MAQVSPFTEMNGRALHFATVADAYLVGRTIYLPLDQVHATMTPVGPECEDAFRLARG